MNIIILAGGAGKRLWPLGRQSNPKQFFPIFYKKPLVVETYQRFAGVYPRSKIFFSVTVDLLPHLKKLFPRVPARQFIVEPARRDTAPAMGFAALNLFSQNPDEPMVFVPSDHYIADKKRFLACLKTGEELIKKTGKLVDIGVVATFPSTALGYTRIGKKYGDFGGVKIYHFQGHIEKPRLEIAKKYLTAGDYLWHGSYYMWTPRHFLEAIKKYAPELYKNLEKIQGLMENKKREVRDKEIENIYRKIPKISFDYAVTEKIKKSDVLIIKGDFGWSDIGAWDVLHQQLKNQADEKGNVTRGQVVHHDTRDCLLYGHQRKILAILGLQDMIVVDTEDALLVCPRERAQEIKKLLEEMEKKGMKRYL